MKTLAPLLVVIALIATPLVHQTASTSAVQSGANAQPTTGYVLKQISPGAVHHELAAKPRLRFWDSTSGNWSGYAVPLDTSGETDTFSAVQGTWTIPTVKGSTSATYSSAWVGIDGYTSGTVEQIGSEQDWTGKAQSNYVWFEMYPNYAYEITGFPANPGNSITAKVQYEGQKSVRSGRRTVLENVFQLTITNNTLKVSYSVPTSYTTSGSVARSSADWIMEAPSSNEILPLADFGTAGFSSCEAASLRSGGNLVPVTAWVLDPLTMIDTNGGASVPSSLSSNGQAFSVTWAAN